MQTRVFLHFNWLSRESSRQTPVSRSSCSTTPKITSGGWEPSRLGSCSGISSARLISAICSTARTASGWATSHASGVSRSLFTSRETRAGGSAIFSSRRTRPPASTEAWRTRASSAIFWRPRSSSGRATSRAISGPKFFSTTSATTTGGLAACQFPGERSPGLSKGRPGRSHRRRSRGLAYGATRISGLRRSPKKNPAEALSHPPGHYPFCAFQVESVAPVII